MIHWPKAVSRRTEAVFVSDRVEGPYVGRDVCSDDMGYHGQGVAQGGIVDTPDGHWYSIMFRDSGAIGRVPALTPVTFRTGCGSGSGDDLGGEFRDGFSGELRDCPGMSFRDGLSGEVRDYHGEGFRDGLSGEAVALGEEVPFPEFGENGLIPADFATPDLKPGYEYEPLFTSDDFMYSVPLTKNASEEWGKEVLNDSVSLKKPWQWNHIPDGANWRILPEGGLAITTGAVSANPTEARNTLTQRMAYPTCSGTVTVDATGLKDGDFAGLIALQGKFGMIGIAKENGSFSLVRLVREEAVKGFGIGSNDREPGVITDRIPIDGPIIRLRIDADFTDMADTAQFSYEKNGTFVKLGGPHKLAFRLDHFTGARFGLCVFATKEPGGTALFRDFRYE